MFLCDFNVKTWAKQGKDGFFQPQIEVQSILCSNPIAGKNKSHDLS